ncbi:hypothetical protein ACLB1Q_26145 [Escherichia coli]
MLRLSLDGHRCAGGDAVHFITLKSQRATQWLTLQAACYRRTHACFLGSYALTVFGWCRVSPLLIASCSRHRR